MKILSFLILALFICSSKINGLDVPGAVADTYAFYDHWFQSSAGGQSTVNLAWTYGSSAQEFSFRLLFRNYPATIKNIGDVVFLQGEYGAAAHIKAFKPTRSIAGGNVEYRQTIKQADLDQRGAGAPFDCSRSEYSAKDLFHDVQTCYGFLAFAHTSELKGDASEADRAHDYNTGLKFAIARWEFQLNVVYHLHTSAVVKTKIKTKVLELPCENCNCKQLCTLDVNFVLNHKLCQEASVHSCDNKPAHGKTYTYGDVATIKFWLDIKTRNLVLHEIHGFNAEDTTGSLLDNALHTRITDNKLGYYYLKFPIAGPASDVGKKFSLKFTFRLTVHSARFLEDTNDRVLQTDTPSVAFTDVEGIRAMGSPDEKAAEALQKDKSTKYPQLNQIYSLVFAIIGVVGLTCICATVGSILPFFKKENYNQLDQQTAKA